MKPGVGLSLGLVLTLLCGCRAVRDAAAAARAARAAREAGAAAARPAAAPSAPVAPPPLVDGKLQLHCPVSPTLARELPPELRAAPIFWYEHAWGYQQALAEQARNPLPILLYFKTDWCPYCKKLDEGLLFPDGTAADLGPVIRVMVNPEEGDDEKALADRFQNTGYPSLRLQMPGAATGVRLSPYGEETLAERVYPLLDLPAFRARLAEAAIRLRSQSLADLRTAALSLDRTEVSRAADAAIAMDPHNPGVRRFAADSYRRAGVTDLAVRESATAALLDSAGAFGDYQAIEAALAPAFRWGDVAGCWSIYLQAHPRDGNALIRRAAAFERLGVPTAAQADRAQACAAGLTPACAPASS